jgi:signal peptidase I
VVGPPLGGVPIRAPGPVRPVPPRPAGPAEARPRIGAPVRPAADDDRPTDIVPRTPGVGGEADEVAVAAPEVPGRHRRRAGAWSDGRPAAADSHHTATGPPSGKPPRTGRRRRPTFWKELPLLVAVALLLTFLIQTFLAKVYVIPSGSMETTLHGCTGCTNDRVLVDKVSYRFGDPQPGDVVVFRGPDSWRNTEFTVPQPDNPVLRGLQQIGSLIGLAPPDEKDFVKRVIAVGGQTVQCCDSRNRVLVDGEPLDEPYIFYLPEAGQAKQDPFGPILVPEGQLWMMGDSRNNSADSRVPGHGPVPEANVIGQARLIVLPFGRFGWIDSVNPQTTAVGMASSEVPFGAPMALGLVGAFPVVAGSSRLVRREDELARFVPAPAAARAR